MTSTPPAPTPHVPTKADMRFYHTSSQPQYKTGGKYQGEWQDNMKHGYGTRSWVNGNKYEGVSKTS